MKNKLTILDLNYESIITNAEKEFLLDLLNSLEDKISKMKLDEDEYKIPIDTFKKQSDKAKNYLSNNEVANACLSFYLIGRNCNTFLINNDKKEHFEIRKNKIQKYLREYHLNLRNKLIKATKTQAQIYANELWKNDKENKIRIGEMSEIVFKKLHDYYEYSSKLSDLTQSEIKSLKKAIPKTPEKIREWLRATAPKYAKKGGRPKKSNK